MRLDYDQAEPPPLAATTDFTTTPKFLSALPVEIVLRRDRRSEHPLAAGLLSLAKRIVRRADMHAEVSRFTIKGTDRETNRIDVVDVLSDSLISKKQIVLEGERTRAVDSASAFAAIEEAYGELRDQIVLAAGIH